MWKLVWFNMKEYMCRLMNIFIEIWNHNSDRSFITALIVSPTPESSSKFSNQPRKLVLPSSIGSTQLHWDDLILLNIWITDFSICQRKQELNKIGLLLGHSHIEARLSLRLSWGWFEDEVEVRLSQSLVEIELRLSWVGVEIS